MTSSFSPSPPASLFAAAAVRGLFGRFGGGGREGEGKLGEVEDVLRDVETQFVQ